MKAAVLYYSSNREDPGFEGRVVENLLKASYGLSIVSVTHKPMDLGLNICVGDVGTSGFNMFRQVLLGCKATDADLIISAESDCLYPPDYFRFRPERLDMCYRNSNLYVMPDRRPFFFRKPEGATHAQVVGREFYISRLEGLFNGAPDWSTEEKNFPKERHRREDVFERDQIEYWRTDNPVFQIKTGKSMRYYTHSDRVPIYSIPYWGDGKEIRNKMIGNLNKRSE